MHMRTRSTLASISCLWLVLASCAESRPSALTLDQYGTALGDATCGVLRDCYGEDLLDTLAPGCVEVYARSWDQAVGPRIEEAIAAGTVQFDGASAQRCLDEIEATGCAVIDRQSLEACEATLVGTVAAGGACNLNEECSGDAFCRLDAMCPGTCQPRAGAAATCEEDDGCQATLRCVDGVCRAPGASGAGCATANECQGGLICFGQMGTTDGECISTADLQTAGLGDACSPQQIGGPLCEPGLSCVLTEITAGPPPAPVFECVSPSASGAVCNVGFPDPCPSGEMCAGAAPLSGDLEGTCTALPTSGPCLENRCADAHRCDGTRCVAISGIGGACMEDADCFSGNCEGGTCAEGVLCGG
jgi:hypothetical protein